MTIVHHGTGRPDQPDLPKISARGLVIPAAILILGLIATLSSLLYHTARQQNQIALEAGQHLATSAIAVVSDEMTNFTRDYSIWNQTVENILIHYDPIWAEDNVGQWVIDGLSMDGSIVFGSGNRIIHQASRAHPDRQIDPATLPAELTDLVALARLQPGEPGEGPTPVTGFYKDSDGLFLAAAAAIVWEDDRPPQLDNGSYGVLLIYRSINESLLSDLEVRFLLNQLTVVPDGAGQAQPFLPLYGASGAVVGGLRWEAEKPGTVMLQMLMAPMAIAVLLVLLLFSVILRRARKAAMVVQDYHDGLQKKTLDLIEARDSAEAANHSKSQFLAMMSHELRTPLNAVIGFSDIIRQDQDGAMTQARILEYAEDIHSSGAYLLALINDILDMSKIEAHRYELSDDIIALDDTVSQSIGLVRGLAQEKKITLRSIPSDLQIRADARAIKQIVVNLLSNAIKFSNPGTTTRVEAALVASGDAEIRVIDQGFGMTTSEVKQALIPFGQSKDVHIRNMQGTGLGLNICIALAELHGGSLHIDSIPGTGTTVTVRLPAMRIVGTK